MSRKDTILFAVVINAGLLAILFATAIIYDPDKNLDNQEITENLANKQESEVNEPSPTLVASNVTAGDEVDNVLGYYSNSSPLPVVVETLAPSHQPEIISIVETVKETKATQKDFVEVVVKKGDVLEKIAKSNGTTVSAIKKANQLKNEKLQIGQVLKIPLKKEETIALQETQSKKNENESVNENEPTYYVLKNGDSPWKIARQYNVKYEDILRLNSMDEEKARNLKVGDRIRIK